MSQLYFLEFFVTELNLGDQIIRDAGEAVFVIKINFIDFKTFEITQQNVPSARVNPPRINSRLNIRAGQACHFTLKPEILVQKILRHPLSIKIFREGDSFPMCLAEIPLSGCLCDQAKYVGNIHLPKPYVFGGMIGLVDIGGNPSGNVDITLRLTCRGKYVLSSYLLEEGCFLFKNDPRGAEFRVERLRGSSSMGDEVKGEFLPPGIDEDKDNTGEEIDWENYVREVGAIFPSGGSLSLGKPLRKEPQVPLVETNIGIDTPAKKVADKMKMNKNKKKKKI